MLIKAIEKSLNEQISVEANSSQFYLAMASWAETKGFDGVTRTESMEAIDFFRR